MRKRIVIERTGQALNNLGKVSSFMDFFGTCLYRLKVAKYDSSKPPRGIILYKEGGKRETTSK